MPSPGGIISTQGFNPGLQHCRWILHHLSHQRSPKVLELKAKRMGRLRQKGRRRQNNRSSAFYYARDFAIYPKWRFQLGS